MPGPWCFASTLKKVWVLNLPEKGFLFGYPIVFKKRNGIREKAETFAGGLYKSFSDYLILSHFCLDWETDSAGRFGNFASVCLAPGA